MHIIMIMIINIQEDMDNTGLPTYTICEHKGYIRRSLLIE